MRELRALVLAGGVAMIVSAMPCRAGFPPPSRSPCSPPQPLAHIAGAIAVSRFSFQALYLFPVAVTLVAALGLLLSRRR